MIRGQLRDDALEGLCHQVSIFLVCDIKLNPISRKYCRTLESASVGSNWPRPDRIPRGVACSSLCAAEWRSNMATDGNSNKVTT